MARHQGGREFTHRPKDLVTMEQAAKLAQLAAREEMARVLGAHLYTHHRPWWKRLWRRLTGRNEFYRYDWLFIVSGVLLLAAVIFVAVNVWRAL